MNGKGQMNSRHKPHLKTISIVIPVYQNAATLIELTFRLICALKKDNLDYQIVFINDASPDNSAIILNNLAKENPHILIVHLLHRNGQHQAIRLGLQYANKEMIAIMDADLQDPPEALTTLIDYLIKFDTSVVFADRRGNYEVMGRLFTSWLFKKLRSAIACVPPRASLFLVMTQKAAIQLMDFYAPQPFLVSMIGAAKLTSTICPVERVIRPYGHSAYSSWDRLKVGLTELLWLLTWRFWHHLQHGYRDRYKPPKHSIFHPPIPRCLLYAVAETTQ